ncbi:MAG TPA: hypothetical protein VFL82_06180, partial [Thermomicrobiales bacterium]|nr:hypothetical protein [Thermomicrobiales bacterium]
MAHPPVQPAPPNPAHRLALLLIDVNKGFFDPRGSLYYPAVTEVVAPLREVLQTARAHQRLVVHAREWHDPNLPDFEWQKVPPH